MAGLFPLSRHQVFKDGAPAGGARLHLFDGGTSTPRVGYKDSSLTSAHPNPILADADGRLPVIFLDTGFYRQRLSTSTGTFIFDDDGLPVVDTVVAGSGTSVDPESIYKTGNVKLDFGEGVIDGYVRANGRSIGSATSGATERANADTEPLYVKLHANANISVVGKTGDAAADFAANRALTLPNFQGAMLAGMPDMGGTTTDTAFAALLAGTTTDPGATAGADTVVIAKENLPSYNLTGGSSSTVVASGTTATESQSHTHSGTTSVENQTHTHGYTRETAGNVQSGTGAFGIESSGTDGTGNASVQHTHTVTTGSASQTHTHNVTVNGTATGISISSGGSGTAVNKLPSLLTVTVYLRL